MRITVVLPVKDGEPYLDAALDSLAAQRRPADEVIAVDDGSCDGSLTRLRARRWVRVVPGPREGIAAAYRAGLAAAGGQAVGFLAQDDVYLPDALAELERTLAAHPEAALAAGNVELFTDGSDFPSLRRDRLAVPQATRIPECVLVRRAAILAAGGIDPAGGSAWDVALFLALDEQGPTVRTSALVARKRLHATSTVHRDRQNSAATLAALRAAIVRRRSTAP
jgi:glycosyltransferase involved in cell wall biosynthesis